MLEIICLPTKIRSKHKVIFFEISPVELVVRQSLQDCDVLLVVGFEECDEVIAARGGALTAFYILVVLGTRTSHYLHVVVVSKLPFQNYHTCSTDA